MLPSLPARAPDPARRARKLADARDAYTFDWSYHGIAGIGKLPPSEAASGTYWAAVTRTGLELKQNEAVSRGRAVVAEHTPPKDVGALLDWAKTRHGRAAEVVATDRDYSRMYATIAAPTIVRRWQEDRVFAWQAVAGANPVMLTRLRRRLDHFPVTEAEYSRALGDVDRFDAALAEGRLYVADYAALDGLAAGTVDGLQKYNFAPIVLYVWLPSEHALRAVLIQTGQSPDHPRFTPADGVGWRMARTVVATADGNWQGIVSHFGLCHQVMESIILSAHRQLSVEHPLMVLLAPHFDHTLLTNVIARSSLVGPGGYMERLQSPTLEESLACAVRQIEAFRLDRSAPPELYADRGVDDVAVLGDYPARDDMLAVWGATVPFVDAYVRLYYTTDADVGADSELRAWVAELASWDGGRMGGVTPPTTVADVSALLNRIINRCTAWHATINYPSFDLFSFPPNLPAAAYGPGPRGGGVDTEDDLGRMLPPYALAAEGLQLFYEISVIQLNRIGEYPEGTFADDRVAPLVAAWKQRLDAVEAELGRVDAARPLTYPYLHPSRISRSIHV